ncbi:unnamed protein product [Tilletia laevis]|uniref:Uncharacterized protein n=1 Tax=Tilletia laevis TaxID=157183 RepID=A0A9N8MCX8_9BASI|nr:unnamed protein product [Tilletia laevis]
MEQASGDKPGAVMSVAREANGKRCALMSEAEQQQQETDGRAGRAQKDEVALSLCSSVYDTTPATQLRRLSSHTSPSISSRATVLPSYVQSCRGREIPPLPTAVSFPKTYLPADPEIQARLHSVLLPDPRWLHQRRSA